MCRDWIADTKTWVEAAGDYLCRELVWNPTQSALWGKTEGEATDAKVIMSYHVADVSLHSCITWLCNVTFVHNLFPQESIWVVSQFLYKPTILFLLCKSWSFSVPTSFCIVKKKAFFSWLFFSQHSHATGASFLVSDGLILFLVRRYGIYLQFYLLYSDIEIKVSLMMSLYKARATPQQLCWPSSQNERVPAVWTTNNSSSSITGDGVWSLQASYS